MERQMLGAFQAAHPGVNLVILEVPKNADGTGGDYDSYLNSLASQGNLPDVYITTSVPDTAGKGWALNVSDYALNDPEYQKVTAVLRENAGINGHVYGIPCGLNFYGIAVNLSIFEDLNVAPLPFDYTLDDLRAKIAEVTTAKYKGIDNFVLEDWGAATLDDSLGFGTFTSAGWHFTAPAYAAAIDIYRDIVARKQTGNTGMVDPATWLPAGVGWAWGEGYVALQYEATWALPGFVNGERPFKADLLPLPNQKLVLIPDYLFIGAATTEPALAYELAKWMSYGKDGQLKRLELLKAQGATWDGVPLAPGAYPEVDAFFLQNYQGLTYFPRTYQLLQEHPENALLEGYKVVPGYARSRFTADTGVLGTVNGVQKSLTMEELINSIIRGERQLADYAAEMERVANGEYQKAVELIRTK